MRFLSLLRVLMSANAGLVMMSAVAVGAEPLDIATVIKRFEPIVASELARDISPGFSVAWIVDGKTVHASGYGFADKAKKTPATADTIYRAGSISKLFNALAAMQLVEKGALDLDAPIQQALPNFHIVVPFEDAGPITIRQLLCHRSGMIRESPVGGYLDNSQPTIAATVDSVASTVLVNRPNARTRYSNVGPTMVGRALEVKTGKSFEQYQAESVLGPLKMTSSAWTMNDSLRPRLAKALMRVAQKDGTFTIQTAPEFELGTIPAGNLYTTANDLAKFASFVLSSQSPSGPTPPILKKENLESMFVPQLADVGFGLGFAVGSYRNHPVVSHSGAVYGFSTSLVMLPRSGIAVVVLSNSDISSGPVRQLMDASLDLLLEVVEKEPPAPADQAEIAPTSNEDQFIGDYESTSFWAKVEKSNGKLQLNLSSQQLELTNVGHHKYLARGRIMNRVPIEFKEEAGAFGFSLAGQEFKRVDPSKVPVAPEAWKGFEGRYGHPFIPLVISIRHGHLYALAENEYDYRLIPVNRVTFRMPPGMYDEEHAVFQTDEKGKVMGVMFANMYLPRRDD